MRVLLFATLAVASFAKKQVHSSDIPELQSWEEWKDTFEAVYPTKDEHDAKRLAFQQNLEYIKTHNARADAGLETYRLGVNEFTDLTRAQFRDLYLGEHKHFEKNYVDLSHLEPAASVDWRAKGAVTPVKNQGQCGSCWSFSTTGSIEGASAILTGNLVSLSEQQLMDCSKAYGDNSCQGGLMDNAFKYVIANKGLDSEKDYPYKMRNESCEKAKEARHVADITGYHDVQQSDSAMQAAISIGPVSVAIEADQSNFQHYRSGTFSGPCGTNLDHGVLAVGYTADYWIVKNSWGASWGDNGYIMMARGSKFGTKGICGILESASYPVASTVGPTSPPSPSPPTPAPGPSSQYYEDPANGGCNSGEQAVRIQGVAGAFCSPKCQGFLRKCPAAPTGFDAQGECALQDQSGDRFCALICDTSDSSACKASAQATCKSAGQGTVGICTYDDDNTTAMDRLGMKSVKHTAKKIE